jgi:hypothetical protein
VFLLLPACGEKVGMRGVTTWLRIAARPLTGLLHNPTSPCATGREKNLPASSHSNSSSARPDNGSGTLMPSALAVFRLI